jgi:hypothetical protein
MSYRLQTLEPVSVDDIPDYPISVHDRLDSHYFLQWNLKRWRGSDFRKKAEPEVGWYGFQLFCIAQDQSPIGTLPCDDNLLAFDLNLTLERWLALLERKVNPLHGWYKVRCDNGEIRWAHEVVTEVAEAALKSNRHNAAKHADERKRKRIGTIRHHLTNTIAGGRAAAQSEVLLSQIDEMIERQHPGGSATAKRIIEAWETISQKP